VKPPQRLRNIGLLMYLPLTSWPATTLTRTLKLFSIPSFFSLQLYYLLQNFPQIMLSLNGLQMLLNYEVIPPTEAPNILRVLVIQVKHISFFYVKF